MYKIIITNPAEEDLKSAVSYIANELKNPVATNNLLDEAQKVINSLSYMPDRYPLVEDDVLSAQEIRMVQINNYLAFYVIRKETKSITILRFLYARRDWISILKA